MHSLRSAIEAAQGFRIHALKEEPIAALPYRRAARGGGSEYATLPVLLGTCSGLPKSAVRGLILTSDLQGVVHDPVTNQPQLLGLAVAPFLAELGESGSLPRAEHLGVLLAGDLFTPLSGAERGGYGPVTAVWDAFAERFAWVAGVSGNHDDCASLYDDPSVGFLDGSVIDIPDSPLVVGGVGRIAGVATKRGRRAPEEQAHLLDAVVDRCDLLVLHEGPNGGVGQDGSPEIRAKIVRGRPRLTLCGHVPWQHPLAELDADHAVLNTEGRVIVLVSQTEMVPPSNRRA